MIKLVNLLSELTLNNPAKRPLYYHKMNLPILLKKDNPTLPYKEIEFKFFKTKAKFYDVGMQSFLRDLNIPFELDTDYGICYVLLKYFKEVKEL